MTPAVLFWCYKDPELCALRLALLRHHDPEVNIYVLYGGDSAGAPEMEAALAPYVQDFWTFSERRSARWKWRHGDLLIAAWHRDRGRHLPHWDQLFVMQWDMIVAAPIGKLLDGLRHDDVLVAGARPVTEIRDWWHWLRGSRGLEYMLFKWRLRLLEGYFGPMHAGLFVVVSLPRSFLDRFSRLALPTIGFLEYKVPSLALAWGHRLWRDHGFAPWWSREPAACNAPADSRLLSAREGSVEIPAMRAELETAGGLRIFHPVQDGAADRELFEQLRAPAAEHPTITAPGRAR